MALVELNNIEKSFGAFTAIRGVSTRLRDGCMTVIVGPSGSGKSTLLRSIAGLEAIDSGSIVIDGTEVSELAPKDRDVAFVFQNYALYPHMNVRDNIAFPLRARGIDREERRARADEIAGRLGLTSQLDKKPGELSGGQQQRVAIGRAIIREPAVFLFDEPLSNLDAQLRIQMRQEILRLREELKVTAVWVTHDQEEAMAMGDEIVVFNEGEIAQQAPPDELYLRPATVYVAKTIGSPAINLLEGEVTAGRFKGPIELDTGRSELNGEVVLGVRPEDINLAENAGGERIAGTITVAVELIELLGPRAIVTMRTGETKLTAVLDRRSLRMLDERGTAEIAIGMGSLHLFDARSERRIESDAEAATGEAPRSEGASL